MMNPSEKMSQGEGKVNLLLFRTIKRKYIEVKKYLFVNSFLDMF